MSERRRTRVLYDGWPIPEVLAGAIVGALMLVTIVAFVRLDALIPQGLVAAAGALIGGVLSYVWRPRRIVLEQRELLPGQQHLTRAA